MPAGSGPFRENVAGGRLRLDKGLLAGYINNSNLQLKSPPCLFNIVRLEDTPIKVQIKSLMGSGNNVGLSR